MLTHRIKTKKLTYLETIKGTPLWLFFRKIEKRWGVGKGEWGVGQLFKFEAILQKHFRMVAVRKYKSLAIP